MYLPDICENPSILRVFLILKVFINILYIVIPALMVIISAVKLGKAVIATDENEIKKQTSAIIKNIIAAFIIYMIPAIIGAILPLTGESFEDLKVCNENATPEKIEYYEVMAPAKKAVIELEQDPTKSNVEKAKDAVAKIAAYGEEDTVIDYLTRISNAEVKANETEDKMNCINSNGIYKNGYCTKIAKPQNFDNNNGNNGNNGNENSNDSTTTTDNIDFTNDDLSGGMKTISVSGQSYKVVNTKADVEKYVKHLISSGVRENINPDVYSGHCLGFAYTHAWGLYTGNGSYTAEDGKNYKGSGHFSTYISDSERDILGKTYEQLSQNKPVIIQVNGNKAGTSRHFVTVVGFKSSVKNANDIKATDLLIIDSYDAQLERMDTSSSRFLTTGAMCHKDYTGYRIQYLK